MTGEITSPRSNLRRTRALRWTLAAIYTIFIYAIAWFVNPLWLGLTHAMGTENAGDFLNRAIPILGVVILAVLLFRRRLPNWFCYLWLLAVAAGFAYVLTIHADYPVERMHLLQYGLVAFFYYRALRLDRSELISHLGAALAVVLIGITDELIQGYFIPGRSGTLDDMIIDWFSGGLGLAGFIAVQRGGFWDFYPRLRPTLRALSGLLVPLALSVYWSYEVYTQYLYPPLNLFLITIDCARPDFWSAYGHKADPPTTKYLDAAAANGAVFTNVFSQAAWTSPGVVSVLSGLYPPTHGVVTQERTIPRVVTTILDAFKDHGYQVPKLSYLVNAAPNFLNLGDFDPGPPGITVSNESVRIADWIGKNHRKPFAMWYHWRYMHLPYNPPEQHWVYPPAVIDPARMGPMRELGLDPREEFAMPDFMRDLICKEVIIPYFSPQALAAADATGIPPAPDAPRAYNFPPEAKEWIDAVYNAQVRHFDHNFERFRYRLALHHKLKNTIIVITADHGEELLDHGYVGHASTAVHSQHYDEFLHIPLVILCPRLIQQGRKIDVLAQQIDILPTIMDMMGWKIPKEAQGRSLLPAIRGEKLSDLPVFSESVEGGYQSKPSQRTTFVRSVRTRDWKFIARMGPLGDNFSLYNLLEDPKETKNVYADHAPLVAQFTDQLGDWLAKCATLRLDIEKQEETFEAHEAAANPLNLSVPEILTPHDGDTIRYETNNGGIDAEWTGNPYAAYIIEYDVGEGWHRLQGKYPIVEGTKHTFGPFPKDGWKPLYQWNPYHLRVRPRDLPDGWSPWITVNVAPIAKGGKAD